MKYFIFFLFPFLLFTANDVFASCAPDPNNINAPCDDTVETLILDSLRIENFDDVWYYVSVSFKHDSTADKIYFHDVTFSPPYTTTPPRYIYSDVTFSDGIGETIFILFNDPSFTKYGDPQAGFIQRISGTHFLVSVNLKELSPLKQFNSEIPFNEIQCKENLVLIQKHDGSPACVEIKTKIKLVERGWTVYDVPTTFDYVIEKDGTTYGSQYQISGGTVDQIVYDKHHNSLIVSLDGKKQGYIQIVIQTGLLHNVRELPFNYVVIIDDEEVEFEQLSPIILRMPFEKDDKQIEIVGTFEIKENEN